MFKARFACVGALFSHERFTAMGRALIRFLLQRSSFDSSRKRDRTQRLDRSDRFYQLQNGSGSLDQ